MKVARIYLRVSTEEQDLTRQASIECSTRAEGYYIAKSAGKYTCRQADITSHNRIIALRSAGHTIERTADLAGCSTSQVKRIWALHHFKS